MIAPKSRAICILGMHRSGTSVITRAINILGAYVGEQQDLLPPKEGNNPEGFWEYKEFVYLQEKILETFHLSWDTTRSLSDGWTKSPAIRPFREKLKAIVNNNFKHRPLWTWKDPRTCLLLPLWQEILEELDIELTYVIAYRNPLDVIASLQKRDGFSRQISENIWYNYTLSSLYDLLGKPNSKKIFVQYDHFLNQPLKCLHNIHDQLMLESPFAITIQNLEGVIKPDLRHSFSTLQDLEQNENISPNTLELYRLCLLGADDVEYFNTDEVHQKVKELYVKLSESSKLSSENSLYEMQIFWSEITEDFTEKNTLRNPIPEDLLFHKYEFILPAQIAFPIRIDPINACSIFEINSISLLGIDNSGKQIPLYVSSDEGFNNLQLINGTLLNSSESYSVLSTEDPQIYLNVYIPENNYDRLKLVVEMWTGFELSPFITELMNDSYATNTEELSFLLESLNQKQEEIIQKQKELTAITEANFRLQNEKVVLSSEIETYKYQNETLNLELETYKYQNETLNSELETYKYRNETLNSELETYKYNNAELSNAYQKSQDNYSNLSLELTQVNKKLAYIEGSRSWRWLAPIRRGAIILRKIKSRFKRTCLKMLGERELLLQPVNDLISTENGNWRSTGDDPQFKVVITGIVGGWVKISFSGNSNGLTVLRLYYDIGNGMNEEQAITLGVLQRDQEGPQSLIVKLPENIFDFRLDPGDQPAQFKLNYTKIRPVSQVELLIYPVIKLFKEYGISFSTFKMLLSKIARIRSDEGWRGMIKKGRSLSQTRIDHVVEEYDYEKFIEHGIKSDKDIDLIRQSISALDYKPLISVLIPIYNVDEVWLRKCIDSVVNQVYSNWELCLVDDCSTVSHIKSVLNEYQQRDSRVKILIRESNGHICATSNDALKLSNGEYIALLDHDDELTIDALYENVLLINKHRDADVIYSDEDKMNEDGTRHSPYFKPDWSPDMLLSQMYICHLSVFRKTMIEEVGGFRKGFEGSQDFDLMLRVSEKTDKIYHIPKVLYHWRVIPQSTASNSGSKNYTHDAGLNAIEEAIIRRKLNAWVEGVEEIPNLYRVHHRPVGNPLVTIIIPTRNMTATLEQCITSIFEKTIYENFEILIVDNGSDDPNIFYLYDIWKVKEPKRFKTISYDIPFNYSKLNNHAAKYANGELLLLLNNDVEIITADWLEEMVGQAIRPEIGAVGANLLYPDQTIQHAGVILGIGGVAGHSHKHYSYQSYGYFSRLKMISNYSAVTAACLMVKKEFFEEVGGLEEELQVAFNDIDFCLKIFKKGYYNIWLPHVQLYHYESKSRGFENTPEKQQRFNGEIAWMRSRWAELLDNDPFYNPNLSKISENFSLGNPKNK